MKSQLGWWLNGRGHKVSLPDEHRTARKTGYAHPQWDRSAILLWREAPGAGMRDDSTTDAGQKASMCSVCRTNKAGAEATEEGSK